MPRPLPMRLDRRALWVTIVIVAVALRLAVGVWWQSRLPPGAQFYFGDSHSYWLLGQAIARGQPYQYLDDAHQVLRTPGYPFLLAALFRLVGDDPPVLAARALSAALGGLAVVAVGWWTARLFDARAALCAAALAAIYPGAVAMGALVLSEAPFCPLMILHLALWGLAWRAPKAIQLTSFSLAGGLCGGLAALMRPSWLLFVPFALGVALLFYRDRARQLIVGSVMCLAVVLVMLPWWIRNFRLTGHFVPTALVVGASLYDGLNPGADGSSNMDFMPAAIDFERSAPTGDPRDPLEYRVDRRLRDAALAWSWAHPARVLQLAATKFWRMWNIWPNEAGMRAWPMRLAVCLTYVPLLALALVGVRRYWAAGWPYVLCWLPAIYFTLLHVVFVGSIRYREPVMLALIPLAAGVLVRAGPPPGGQPLDQATC